MSTDGLLPISCFINGLDSKLKKKIFKQLEMIENAKMNPLKPPHVKSFRVEKFKGLYELRTKIKKVIRIIFYVKEGEIILLHAFTKKHERATEKALEIAIFRVNALKTCISDKIIYGRK